LYTVEQILQDHMDETHQSHDCALGIAYLFEYLIDLESFWSTLPIVCDDNQRNIHFELRFEVLMDVKFRILVARVIWKSSNIWERC
jgi:hypothetical protein